jgi:hypothetical protein
LQPEPFLYCGFAAALILSIAWRPWRKEDGEHLRGYIGNALAWTAATFLAARVMKGQLPSFPPTEAEHYWAYGVLLCTLPAALEARSWRLASVLGVSIFGAFAWLASAPLRESYWEGNLAWFQVGAGVLLGLATMVLRPGPAASWARGPSYPGTLALATAMAAALLGQSYGGAAHVIGALAFVPAIVAILAMLRPERVYWPGLASSWSMGVPGMLVVAVWFAETPWSAAVLVALSAQLARLPLPARMSPRQRAILHGALVVVVGGVALWLGYEPPASYDDY